MYPFRMYGEIVELYRFKVEYTKDDTTETAYFVSREEADVFAAEQESSAEELDTAASEWFEGLVFSTFEDARTAYDMGEETYKKLVAQQEAAKPETQITDLQLAMVESYESTAQQITDIQLALAELYERGSM